MVLAQLVLLAFCGWADESTDPSALVTKLSSSDQAVRAEAAGKLEELGRPALPALYRSRSAADAGFRLQVERLIDLIERQRLLRATRVRLDLLQVPLEAAVDELRTQTGIPVVISSGQTLRSRRVTLHAHPVPFWEAVDRLGAAYGARATPWYSYIPDPSAPAIMLVAAEGPAVPASDAGPFRVQFVRLSRHREIKTGRAPAHAGALETLTAELHVLAEPGLVVSPTGPVAVNLEVVDDRGGNLRRESVIGPASSRMPTRFDAAGAGLFSLSLTLDPQAPSGGSLRHMTGRVPISVIARTGDPIDVPLAGSAGKTFSRAGVTLSVAGVKSAGGKHGNQVDRELRSEHRSIANSPVS